MLEKPPPLFLTVVSITYSWMVAAITDAGGSAFLGISAEFDNPGYVPTRGASSLWLTATCGKPHLAAEV